MNETCPEEYRDQYLKWLLNLAGLERSDGILLFSFLLDMTYYWQNDYDQARAGDGRYLRYYYVDKDGIQEAIDNFGHPYADIVDEFVRSWPVSVIEVLLAMAIRLDKEYEYCASEGDRASLWFWIMCENLGLDLYLVSNADFNINDAKMKVIKWMDGDYDKNGKGSPMALPDGLECDKDYREMSFWEQVTYWCRYAGYIDRSSYGMLRKDYDIIGR